MIQYSRDGRDSLRGAGVLDSPLQCAIAHKAGNDSGVSRPYSAGLVGVDTSVPVLDCAAAAAFFSTMATAMIEPS